MTIAPPESASAALEVVFTSIQEQRMADVPVLNQALEVQAVGFMPWNEHYVGILITPWFMNLMLLPQEPSDDAQLAPGTKTSHTFPSGEYEFIAGEETDLGPYQMCSLYSPMFEFENQEAAAATATHVMEYLMTEDQAEGDEEIDNAPGFGVEPIVAASKKTRTISRRALFRGTSQESGK